MFAGGHCQVTDVVNGTVFDPPSLRALIHPAKDFFLVYGIHFLPYHFITACLRMS